MKLFLGLFFSIVSIQAEIVNIEERIQAKRMYRDVYPLIFGKSEIALDKDFKSLLEGSENKERALSFVKKLDPIFPKNILKSLIYWKFLSPNEVNVKKVLLFYAVYKILLLRDKIDSPMENHKYNAEQILRKISFLSNVETSSLLKTNLPNIEDQIDHIMAIKNENVQAQAISETDIFSINFKKYIPDLSPHVLSYTGIIPGNKITLLSKNSTSLETMNWFNENAIFAPPFNGKIPFEKLYMRMPTRSEPMGHPSFLEDPIFMKIRDLVLSAQDSIFIDIFLFGGTIGGTLSKFLVEQVIEKSKKNPNFKALILHDFATNYNMKEEMMPIFEYLRDEIATNSILKDHLYLLQANIQRHPPGVPFGLTNLIHKSDELFNEIEKRNTYYESKIDHSKVLVVDANTNPKAYFGSKNWSDHSGGYYYDNTLVVEGPAAALVQEAYWGDIEAALTLDPEEQKWFYFKEQGFDNKKYLPFREDILQWFKISNYTFEAKGEDHIRFAQADIDGIEKNTRNILLDMIINAQKNIYMEQLFFYDPYIADALMKKKVLNPNLDVRIIIDHNKNFGLNGLPNTIFLKEMIDLGIKVKARKLIGTRVTYPEIGEKEYNQENHRKITSVDGKILLLGSSNINPDTLQGSFREFGGQIFSIPIILLYEENFLTTWNDPEETLNINIEDFQIKIKNEYLPKSISKLFNDILASLLRSKDTIERRY